MMKRFLLLIALLAPLAGSAEPLGVFVSVLPLKTIVEKVGGEHVEVRVMVEPGHGPATYAPTPRQITALAETALYVRTGVPFEDVWMERIRSANPDMQVLDAREGLDTRAVADHAHGVTADRPGTSHAEPEQDPHVWTSPLLAKQMSVSIRDALAGLDPDNGADFARNQDAFAAEMDALDRDIRLLLEDVSNGSFMVFHPAWGYFADSYGLTQVPIEAGGKEPGARSLTELIEEARNQQVKVIFVQPQLGSRSAVQIARAIGGRVLVIDPLAADYADNLREVAREIAAAARR
jgi:zinc transport system substrate-binding protein